MKKTVVFLLCMYGYQGLLAQQLLGIRNSNYAGIQGALLNPASIARSPLKWDVNVFSVDEVFANNFLYAPKSRLSFFGVKKIIDGAIHENLFGTHYDIQNPNKLYNVSFSTEILGPSFFVTVAKKHKIGFTMAARAYSNVRDITGNAAQNAFDYLLNSSLWNMTSQDHSARVNSMGWLQYGLHYATTIYSDGRNQLNAGISLNYLQGLGAAYVKNTNLNYRIVDTTHVLFYNSSVDYGRTAIDDFKNGHDLTHGHGFGADIGFNYIHFGDDKDNYLYRLGVSLIDIGSIMFNKNTGTYHLETAGADFSNWHQSKFTGNTQLDQTLSAVFYHGDSSKSMTAGKFRMAMPAALSIQFDWNVYEKFFANATIVKGLGHGDNPGVTRPDVYSLTPRYETKWWELSLPVSLLYYHRWQPRVGLAVRAGYFFIGGDGPGALLKLNDLQNCDFYAGVHYFVPEKTENKRTSLQ